MTTQRLGVFIGGGATFQRQIPDFQIHLVKFMEEVEVKGTLAGGRVVPDHLLGDFRGTADGYPEAADGPQEELDHPLHIAVIGLSHVWRSMDKGVADGNLPLVPLHGDGDGLLCIFQVCVHPDAEGDKAGIQLGRVLGIVLNS